MSHRSTIVIVVCSILFLVFDVSAAPAYDSSALFSRLMKGDTLDNFGPDFRWHLVGLLSPLRRHTARYRAARHLAFAGFSAL